MLTITYFTGEWQQGPIWIPSIKKIKKSIRIISFKDSDHPSTPLYKDLKVLPLWESIDLRNAKFMWKLVNGFLPPSLSSNFRSNSRTTYSKSLSRLKSLKTFILYAGPVLWDNLPMVIKQGKTLKSFSESLTTHYLTA